MSADKDLWGNEAAAALRDKRGRKRHAPTAAMKANVETLSGYGVPQDDIARVLLIDPTTLRKRYRDELDRGTAIANAKVAQNLFTIATGGGREAVTAAIFWLKCRAGWSEFSPPAAQQPREAPLGKKDAAQLAAETAEQGTGWAGLVH